MFLKYQIRKPFSRKIRPATDILIDVSARERFMEKYAPLFRRDPLAGALGTLAAVYAGEFDAADALMDRLIESVPKDAFAKLFATSDIRKFMMAGLRDFYAAGGQLDGATAAHLKAFSAAFDPASRHVFDPPAYVDQEVPLRTFEYESAVPKALKIGIYFRSKFYPTSRPHDLAYRFKTAFEGAGAHSEIVEPDREPGRFVDCDIALIDDPHVFRKSTEDKRRFLEQVRKRTKSLVMLEMDPWAAGLHQRVADNRDIYDVVWAMIPSLIGDDGTIDGLKASSILFPVGAPEIFKRHRRVSADMPGEVIKFCGGIEEYNFFRYFWVVGALAGAHPPTIEVTNHGVDNLSIADSLDHYVKRLGSSHACLNFIRRASGETSMVGRTSDALCLQQLLVQEASIEVRPYLTPGEHFLQFSTLEELDGICERLMINRQAFEGIRQSGADYFARYYSDNAVLRHMATWC